MVEARAILPAGIGFLAVESRSTTSMMPLHRLFVASVGPNDRIFLSLSLYLFDSKILSALVLFLMSLLITQAYSWFSSRLQQLRILEHPLRSGLEQATLMHSLLRPLVSFFIDPGTPRTL
ncbi:hypothetical protein BV25DRAFT_1571322 [Artomyces pyxidatus]|uniref:Uncharacterized protein n=1 Tax=Artomyces pyxidatus TaxID=48021 RepID=A0ACB8SJX5_9AGAM|nr:hypothetical protein BV25DRAFT_1571322 [Artomyces pyxidatus]